MGNPLEAEVVVVLLQEGEEHDVQQELLQLSLSKGLQLQGYRKRVKKKSEQKQGIEQSKQTVAVVECSKLIGYDSYNPSCMMSESQGYKHLRYSS